MIYLFLISALYFFAPTVETFTTPGAGQWSKPAGVTTVIVECWAGGGGGGGGTGVGGGGGGGGQYSTSTIIYSSAAQDIDYTVAASVSAETDGEDTTWDTNVIIAKGGEKGTTSGMGGSGYASGAVGDAINYGGNGGYPAFSEPGHAGGGAGSTGFGKDANPGGPGGSTSENGGAGGAYTFSGAGGNGSAYGGGGGGGAGGNAGGTGAQGLIRITYTISLRRIFID